MARPIAMNRKFRTMVSRLEDFPQVGERMLGEWQAGVGSLCEGKTIHVMEVPDEQTAKMARK
ncbi:hypothetical protein C8D77_11049 [Mesorhizobium loti]|jgi:hypothetical protein|uniref:Uncharacterized protein n=1 Tax=Rhizobium loti TaxID=381 RepID=A0A8E2W8E9_RHILI|nr:hypothetical protein C8D77_11049 [Mesorhizobium loti]